MISFKNIKDENLQIDLKNVLLSKNNPRYTILNSFEISLKKFITEDIDNFSQDKIFEKLFLSEGDLSDLYELLSQIDDIGFSNKFDPIILIKKNDKFVVAERNRRIMCLKLITDSKNFSIPKIELLQNNSKYISNENSEKININEINYELEENDISLDKNYIKVKNLIDKLKKEDRIYNVYCEILENDDDLWKIIYDKHLTGERPGMRKWSRSKYFADLLKSFSRFGINKHTDPQVFSKINRCKKYIISDFKESQFIYLCFYYGLYCDNDEKKDNTENHFSDDKILDQILKSNRISALERNHSYNKIIDTIKKYSIIPDIENFTEKYFDISFDKNNHIIINEGIIKQKKLFRFIFEKWSKGIITTRPIKEKFIDDFIKDIKTLILNVNYNEKIDLKKLDEINEFDLSMEENSRIFSVQKIFYKNNDKKYITRFNLAENIISTNNEINNNMSKLKKYLNLEKISFINVFDVLHKQFIHNSKKTFFLNAISTSIRSYFEQLMCWGLYNYYLYENNEIEKQKIIDDLYSKKKWSIFLKM